MVDYAHLSEGNSVSSPSRNLFDEYGVSKPSSPNGVSPDPDMSESTPVPVAHIAPSDSSPASENADLVTGFDESMREVFKAAQIMTQKDRVEAIDERRKNQDLWNFIMAHGFCATDVSKFVAQGKQALPRQVSDLDLIVGNKDISTPVAPCKAASLQAKNSVTSPGQAGLVKSSPPGA